MITKPLGAMPWLPVSLAEAKLNLRIDHDLLDAQITSWIQAAVEQAELTELRAAVVGRTWELRLDAFPPAEIALHRPPVRSIVSVTYLDPQGATQTINPSLYTLDDWLPGGWVLPAAGYTWPVTADAANAVRVRFEAGYATAADVPAAIKRWVHLQVGAAYRNSEAFSAGVALYELPSRYTETHLDPFRYWGNAA
jgi:uncharacterized phiE125 gp8 family phage protein